MFVDKVQIRVKAGDGGNGCLSFRHEKFVDKGGPDGGDGGRGGNVVFVASRNEDTLATFRYRAELAAEPGNPGSKQRKHGKNGQDLLVKVPIGTSVTDESGVVVADLVHDGDQAIVARGGSGGYGNAHFVSSVRQAPRVVEKGEEGRQFLATLELKMIADVGLVGLPNAGKSTLLASISNARPEIANYPFTTLTPNLGVVDIDGKDTLLLADIPGLIEGASQGKGLGDEFLRHVERTHVLLHLVDMYANDVAADYQTTQNELAAYSVDLTQRPQVVALSKIEGMDDDIVQDKLSQLQRVVPSETPLLAISSHSKQGIQRLLYQLQAMVADARQQAVPVEETLPVLRMAEQAPSWHVIRQDDQFVVSGHKIEKFAVRTDFDNPQSVQRLRDIMKKMGIMREFVRQGINPDDVIRIKGVDGHLLY
ncbi:GTP1/OBG sub domain protein [Candidatus Saccharibacteria bacterium]|nr:MAG: GTP1/OBG sub domain protein [Candidatus Saccharibacteria bacterium]